MHSYLASDLSLYSMDSSCHGEHSGVASHPMGKLSVFYNALEGPEPLGSVTHNQEIDGSTTSLQIRSSARVSKKMRLDSITTPVATVVLEKIDKKDLIKDEGKPEKPEKSEKPEKPEKHEKADKHEKAEAKQNEGKTKKRPFELWSQEDKNIFFEALNEYGKNFDSIQNHFATKAKKKGLAEHLIKNKDQVRLFYYRTWHKISKYLKFDGISNSEVKNATKEVYGLINYGEIRKRIGFCTEKIMCMKLNDLVYRGTVQLRIKGKTLRIKTPLCRALRRLNRIEECQEVLKLPARVTIELRPRTNDAWTRVQSAAQNPRIRTLLPLQKRLASFIAYLSHRWQEPQLKLERFQTWLADGTAEHPPKPGKGCTSRKGGKKQKVNSPNEKKLLLAPFPAPPPPPPLDPPVSEVTVVKQKETVCPETEFVNCGVTLDNACDNNVGCKDGGDNHLISREENEGASTSTAPQPDSRIEEMDNIPEVTAQPTAPIAEAEPKVNETEEIINRIRAGWTVEDSNSVSIGELYLMFGSDTKLRMEYWWEDAPPASGSTPTPAPVPVPNPSPLPGPSEAEFKTEPANPIADTLQKLISIAKLNYRRAKVICPCGHVCGTPIKPAVNVRRSQPIRNLPDNGPGAKPVRPAVSVSVTSLHDGVFRRPLLAPSQYKPLPKPGTDEALKAQLDKFRPRYCNRRGRAVRPKNVVVQRMLPLLPKAPNGHAMVTLKVIPQTSQLSGEFMPIGTTVPATTKQSHSQPAPLLPRPSKNQHILPATSSKTNTGCILVPSTSTGGLPDLGQDITPVTLQQTVNESGSSGVSLIQTKAGTSSVGNSINNVPLKSVSNNLSIQQVGLPQNSGAMSLHSALGSSNGVASGSCNGSSQLPLRSSSPSLNTPVASPPSISNLLELSLPSTVGEELATISAGTSSGLLDVQIQDSSPVTQPNFVGLLSTEGTLQSTETPPTSPSRILKEADNQWLNSEVADFSLSSFLGHLESPLKAPASNAAPSEDTRLCSDVEAQLQCLMSENSVDYMAKFADLAAQIALSDASNKK
ncbi:hypothetical protein C0J52_16418 [Blattella germanica]|nr:hypothetical protein C0J52_16418 [Blattella germanica]